MKLDVVGFGALNMDRLYQVNRIACEDEEAHINSLNESCGGSAANTIIGLAKLGLKTGFLGKVARDREGGMLIDHLKGEGVDCGALTISDEGRSGTVQGFVDPEGQRALYVDPGVNDEIDFPEVDLEYASDARLIHLSSFVGESIEAQKALLEKIPGKVKVSLG
jgi:ribokinase